MTTARGLLRGRELFQKDNNAFHRWMVESKFNIPNNDREALLNLARYPVEAEAVLLTTKSHSLQLIWAKEVRPMVKGGSTRRQ